MGKREPAGGWLTERNRARVSRDALDLAVDALACYRLTRLTAQDEITEDPRDALRDWLENHGHDKLAVLAACPYCQSVYWAAGVTLARQQGWAWWRTAAPFLAVAGAVAIIVAGLTPPDER